MRQDYFVTISDYRSTRHFTLRPGLRRGLVAAAAALLMIMIAGWTGAWLLSQRAASLNGEVAEISAERQRIASELKELDARRRSIESELQRSRREVALLERGLEEIEALVGLDQAADHPIAQRVDLATHTALEKRLMLRSIPSGFPVASERVTSDYGMRRHPLHDREALHGGVDLRATRGTPIHATADGVVEWAAVHRESGLGKMVKLVHNYGFATIYGHLDQIEVKPGTYVQRGDLIGHSGNTGASAAPHLHYEVRYLQRRLDPKPFLRWSLEEFDGLFSEEERVEWESLTEIVRTAASTPERRSLQPVQSLSATSP